MNYGNQAIEKSVRAHMEREYVNGAQLQNAHALGQDCPQPVTPMNGAVAELQMSLDVLSKVAEELRMRLSPVLRSCGPENGAKEGPGLRDNTSPLREQLGGCAMRVGSIRNTLNDILDRLEV